MTVYTPLWLGPKPGDTEGPEYAAREDRQILATLFSEGVGNVQAGHLVVGQRAAGANMTVEVAPGTCYITGDDVARQGMYRTDVTAVESVTIAAAPASNSRIDLIVARVYDAQEIGGSKHGLLIESIQGVAAASPAAPAVPNTAIPLAQVLVAAGATSIQNSAITDRRMQASSAGTSQVDVFTVSGVWTKPPSARSVTVTVIGGGGGGGAWRPVNGSTSYAISGGSGGGHCQKTFAAALLPNTVNITVGAGGAGAAPVNSGGLSNGGGGGVSYFGNLVTAGGGNSGVASGDGSLTITPGGNGGGFYALASTSGVENNPDTGGRSLTPTGGGNSPHGGGGGGGAASSAAGAGGTGGTPCDMGSSSYGPSGLRRTTDAATAGTSGENRTGIARAGDGGGAAVISVNGSTSATATGGNGGIPGGGGGSAMNQNSSGSGSAGPAVGGAGARGEVIVITHF